MTDGEGLVLPPAALADAKAYLRVGHDDEDALLQRLTKAAAELCERFTGQALIARSFSETMAASPAWRRLGQGAVRAITAVEAVPRDGPPAPLPADAFAVDIDALGDGWVRTIDAGGAPRVRTTYEAGLAAEWDGAPEALRQGILRLAAHLFTHRDDADAGEPPAAVTALWGPWRRIRIG